jgi:hypothetical protein
MPTNVNAQLYLPLTLARAQSTPTSLYHKMIWRQGTNFRLRQDWKRKKPSLGWLLDTRCLLFQLPKNKFVARTNMIKLVTQQGIMTTKEVKSIIGCLGT